jgi:hypothetical protein
MSVYNLLCWFSRNTDVRVYNTLTDPVSLIYEGKVETLPINSMTWRVVSSMIFSGVLTIYCEVEE